MSAEYSLAAGVAAIYRDDQFAARLLAAFDDSLEPIVVCVDNLAAYLDPGTTPDGLIEWLAGWLGISLDEAVGPPRRRRMLAAATEVTLWRGTVRGLRAALVAYCGASVEVQESGSVTWTRNPAATPPARSPTVTIRLPAGVGDIDRTTVGRIVADTVPAHVRVEIAQ